MGQILFWPSYLNFSSNSRGRLDFFLEMENSDKIDDESAKIFQKLPRGRTLVMQTNVMGS